MVTMVVVIIVLSWSTHKKLRDEEEQRKAQQALYAKLSKMRDHIDEDDYLDFK